MNWLAGFTAVLVQKLWPWLTGVIASWISAVVNWIGRKREAAKESKQRDEATKELQEAIEGKLPREERQKREENSLNS